MAGKQHLAPGTRIAKSHRVANETFLMIATKDLRTIARARMHDARVLLQSKRFDGAFYLYRERAGSLKASKGAV